MFDRYDNPLSVKTRERTSRANGEMKSFDVGDGRAVPKWKNFLSVSENKASLCEYITGYVIANAPEKLGVNCKIILSGVSVDV